MTPEEILAFSDSIANKTATPVANNRGVLETVTLPKNQQVGAPPQPAAPSTATQAPVQADMSSIDLAMSVLQGTPAQPTAPVSPVAPEMPVARMDMPPAEPTVEQERQGTLAKMPVAFVQRWQGLKKETKMGATWDWEGMEAQLPEYREHQQGYRDLGGNWFVGAAAVLPDMMTGAGGRLTGAALGAAGGAGLALGLNAIPGLAATPEEAFTVPLFASTGAKIGANLGGASPMYLQGRGQLYADMRERGIEGPTAAKIATIGAGPYAAIEFMNIYLRFRMLLLT
jgi:hypothetical protein